MDKEFELKPNDNRKSFYGKAKVVTDNGISDLISYTTKVVSYNHFTNKMSCIYCGFRQQQLGILMHF